MKIFFKFVLQYKLLVIRNILEPFGMFNEVSILCYHSIDDSKWDISVPKNKFIWQMHYLKRKRYYFATLDEILAYKKKEIDLPRKTVAITFDDGYRSVYQDAFPILKELHIPISLFLVGDFEGSKKYRGTSLPQLNKEDIKSMIESGLVQIHYHSKTHKMLDSLSDDEIIHELDTGVEKYKYFAYPGGHYSNNVLRLIHEAGFKAAFGIGSGLIHQNGDIFLIKRNVILSTMGNTAFKIRVTKAIDWYKYLVHLIK